MDGKIPLGRQYHQALDLIQAELDSLRPSIQIAEHLAREAASKLRMRNFLRTLVGVFAVAAIIVIVLSIYTPREHNPDIGLASRAELQTNTSAPETSVLLALEDVENCPSTRLTVGDLGNTKLLNLLRMASQNDSTLQEGNWSSDGSTFILGDWTEKENSNIRVLDASACEEPLKTTKGKPNQASWPPDE